MKNKFIKTLAIVLSTTMVASSSFPAFAYDVDEHDNSIESTQYQNTENENFNNATNVFAQLGSEYKVTIPKVIVLSGATKDARYYVKVVGDIAGDESISVIPDNTFSLHAKNKDAQTAIVNQDRTSWTYGNLGTDANGTITASDITAGTWQGFFNFNINLAKVLGDIILPAIDDPSFNIAVEIGENKKLISTNTEIKSFTSDNEDVVKINPDGTFITVGAGTATLTIVDKDGNVRKIPVVVERTDNIVPNLNLEEETHIEQGKTLNLAPTSNNKIELKNVKYISSNPEILTVDENGNVKAVGKGTATITIVSDNSVEKTITITSDAEDELNISMDNEKPVSIEMGETVKKVNIEDATFVSDNPEIVTVDEQGNIIPKNVGSTVVTVKTPDGKTKKILITVKPTDNIVASADGKASDVFNIKATDSKSINLASSNTMQLKDVTFESSDPSVATVDNNGNVTALKEGTVTVTIKSTNSVPKTVTIVVGHNYVEGKCTVCGDVLPALSVSANGFTGTYDGKAHSISVTSSGNVVQYSTDNKTWSNTNPSYTNAGTYTVYYKVSKDGYKTVTGSANVVINKANSTVATAPTTKSLTYTGSTQTLVNAGSATNGTMQYSIDNKTWSTTIPTGTNAGTYTVYYKVVGNANYNDVASKSVAVTIAKKNNAITPNPTRLTISDANNKTIAITNPSNGTLSIVNSDNSIATASLSGTNITVKPLKEGITTITIKSAATSNYNAASKTVVVDVSHNYVNGKCSRCGQVDINKLSGGMYDANYNLVKSWEALVNEGTITVNNGAMHIGSVIGSADSGTGWPENTKNTNISGIIVVPESITKLDTNAFYSLHNLTGVVLPSSLKTIGNNAFYGVQNMHLSSILIKDGNTSFKTVDGILYNANMTTLIKYPVTKTATSFTVPSSVKIIDSSAFAANSYIRNVTLPTGITDIRNSAFDVSGLQTINLPNTLKTIGAYAFCNCPNLISITLPDSLTRIDTAAFAVTNIRKVFIPKSVTTINANLNAWGKYDGIFAHCPIDTIYCEAPSKPSGWNSYWDVRIPDTTARCNVVWNATR